MTTFLFGGFFREQVWLVFGLNKHFMAAGITIFIIYPLVYAAMTSQPASKALTRSEAAHA